MPTATRAPRRRKPVPVDPEPTAATITSEDIESATASLPDRAHDFDPLLDEVDGGVPFFTTLQMIGPEEWPHYLLYLYRLDPKIRVGQDETKYLRRYQGPIDEDDIVNDFGGGKYELWLKLIVKRGEVERVRRHRFSIEGRPVIAPGQTIVGNPAAASGSARDDSGAELAKALPELVRTLSNDRNNNAGANNQVVEAMGAGMKGVLSIVTETMRQSVTSVTGTASGDKLLDLLMTQLKAGTAPPQRSATEEKLISIALDRIANPQPATDASAGELGLLKELLGGDNLLDLIRGTKAGPGDAWKSKLVEIGGAFVANLPGVIAAVSAMQERQFHRQIQLEAMRAGKTDGAAVLLPPGAPVPTATVVPPAPHTATPGSPGSVDINPVDQGADAAAVDHATMALNDIVFAFQAGLNGDGAASLIMTKYPDFVLMFKPLLENPIDQVKLFCQNTPPLSAIAGDEEFSEFLGEFIQEMLKPEESTPGPELVNATGVQ